MIDSQYTFELLRAGDEAGLLRILEEDHSLANARDAKGVSLVMQALYHGRRALAERIADWKPVLDILEAASLGQLERLKELAGNPIAVQAFSGDGFTALHYACYFGPPEAAEILVESGADVSAAAKNPMQVMPLHSAASARNLKAARLLLEHGADVNARQHGGWAPIHAAAQNGDRAMVELLLKHDANARVTNDEGQTPAMVARDKGYEEIAALLDR